MVSLSVPTTLPTTTGVLSMKSLNIGKTPFYLTFTVFFGFFGYVTLYGLSPQEDVLLFSALGGVFGVVTIIFGFLSVRGYIEKFRLLRHGTVKWYDAVDLADDPSITVNGVWNVFIVLVDPDDELAPPILSASMRGWRADRILGHKVPVYVIDDKCWVDYKHYDKSSTIISPLLKVVREDAPDATQLEVDRAIASLGLLSDEIEVNCGAIAEEILCLRQA